MTINYGWDDVHAAVCNLAAQIKRDKADFCCIVAPVRGGLIPGVMLSHILGIPLFPITWSLRDHKATEDVSPALCKLVSKNPGKHVLLVDDILDGGDTIKSILHHLVDIFPVEDLPIIRTAVIVNNTDVDMYVSFDTKKIQRSVTTDWVIFPWELNPSLIEDIT